MKTKYHLSYPFIENPVQYHNTLLVQIGRRHCMPEEKIEKHSHLDWYELTIVIEGEGIILTNDEPVNVSKGDIYLSFPCDFHEIVSSSDKPLKYNFFSFNTKNELIKKELKRIALQTHFCEQRVFRDESVSSAVSFCVSEISTNKKYKTELLSLTLEKTLFLIIRNFDENKTKHTRLNVNANDELCFQIMHYIDTHIYSIENLSELSNVFGFNYSYLSKLFKNTVGKTISNYYQTKRLGAAELLMSEKKLKISQIAELLNYSSLYSFSNAFKSKYGISPSHYLD